MAQDGIVCTLYRATYEKNKSNPPRWGSEDSFFDKVSRLLDKLSEHRNSEKVVQSCYVIQYPDGAKDTVDYGIGADLPSEIDALHCVINLATGKGFYANSDAISQFSSHRLDRLFLQNRS